MAYIKYPALIIWIFDISKLLTVKPRGAAETFLKKIAGLCFFLRGSFSPKHLISAPQWPYHARERVINIIELPPVHLHNKENNPDSDTMVILTNAKEI